MKKQKPNAQETRKRHQATTYETFIFYASVDMEHISYALQNILYESFK